MFISIISLVGGLAAILLGANWLVDGASSIARKFKISNLVIGLTIVGFGTSSPELTISIMSAIKGNTEIAIGNILGSNISNIFLILGISAIIFPIVVQRNTKWKEIPFSLLAAVVIAICANDIFFDNASSNTLSRIDGLVMLCFLIIFVVYTFGIARNGNNNKPDDKTKILPMWKSVVFITIGITGLFFGGKYLVDGAVDIAKLLGMSETVIGLTIVAIGTSSPELATSIVAALKKNSDIAVGNVVGSNIFNIFLILGITSTIKPLPFHDTSNIDLAVTILASLLLFATTITGGKNKIDRFEGIIFVTIYLSYITYLIIMQPGM